MCIIKLISMYTCLMILNHWVLICELKQEVPPKLDQYELHVLYIISFGCIVEILAKLIGRWTILTTRGMY